MQRPTQSISEGGKGKRKKVSCSAEMKERSMKWKELAGCIPLLWIVAVFFFRCLRGRPRGLPLVEGRGYPLYAGQCISLKGKRLAIQSTGTAIDTYFLAPTNHQVMLKKAMKPATQMA